MVAILDLSANCLQKTTVSSPAFIPLDLKLFKSFDSIKIFAAIDSPSSTLVFDGQIRQYNRRFPKY